jgi:hypothetical protein
VKAEEAGPECPEEVGGDHRDRTGGDVDDAGTAVDEDDTERDAGDQGPRAQPECPVEDDVLHPASVWHGAPGPTPAGPGTRSIDGRYFAPGGFSQPEATFQRPLPV